MVRVRAVGVVMRTILRANRQTVQFVLGQFEAHVARALIRIRANAIRAMALAHGQAHVLIIFARRISDVAFARVWSRAPSVHASRVAYGFTNVISLLVTVATSLLKLPYGHVLETENNSCE